ncbi:MAG: hypothetical protein AB7J32_18165 [Pseudonocardia sp.]
MVFIASAGALWLSATAPARVLPLVFLLGLFLLGLAVGVLVGCASSAVGDLFAGATPGRASGIVTVGGAAGAATGTLFGGIGVRRDGWLRPHVRRRRCRTGMDRIHVDRRTPPAHLASPLHGTTGADRSATAHPAPRRPSGPTWVGSHPAHSPRSPIRQIATACTAAASSRTAIAAG